MHIGSPFGAERKKSVQVGFLILEKMVPIGVLLNVSVFVIIEPRSPHLLVLHRETQGFNQVEFRACVGGQTNDIARVGRDFRLVEDNLKHGGQS